jgi:hypothetical protein
MGVGVGVGVRYSRSRIDASVRVLPRRGNGGASAEVHGLDDPNFVSPFDVRYRRNHHHARPSHLRSRCSLTNVATINASFGTGYRVFQATTLTTPERPRQLLQMSAELMVGVEGEYEARWDDGGYCDCSQTAT